MAEASDEVETADWNHEYFKIIEEYSEGAYQAFIVLLKEHLEGGEEPTYDLFTDHFCGFFADRGDFVRELFSSGYERFDDLPDWIKNNIDYNGCWNDAFDDDYFWLNGCVIHKEC